MRARTVPDLDISGIAELVEEPPVLGIDESFDSGRATRRVAFGEDAPRAFDTRPTRVRDSDPFAQGERRSSPEPYRSGAPAAGQRSGAPPAQSGPNRSGAPPAQSGRRGSDPVARSGRPSRNLREAYDENGEPLYGANDEQRAPSPVEREVLAPPSGTPIAVRPLPPPQVVDKRLVVLTEPYSARADAYRALRRKLLGANPPRTIAITSAGPGEGKTTLATNLALAIREATEKRVLLIEANVRTPSIAKVFGFDPPECFVKQMAKNRDGGNTSWTVVEQYEPLHVLAVDPAAKNPPLLDPVAFANALEQLLGAGYDHILIDTPHALGGPDVNLVADAVEGVVVVAWIKKSKKSEVKKAVEQLKPAPILGVVALEG